MKSGFTYLKFSFLDKFPFLEKMSQEKWQNKAHMYKGQNVKIGIFEAVIWSKFFFYTKVVRKYRFKCHKWYFITKGEIESNFLTTPSEDLKLNHSVNTTLNQLAIQFERSSRCI